MQEFSFTFQNILDANGLQIAIAGMVIVFLVLAMVSAFIWLLPHTLQVVNRVFPEVQHAHLARRSKPAPVVDDSEIAAALAMVLHERARGGK